MSARNRRWYYVEIKPPSSLEYSDAQWYIDVAPMCQPRLKLKKRKKRGERLSTHPNCSVPTPPKDVSARHVAWVVCVWVSSIAKTRDFSCGGARAVEQGCFPPLSSVLDGPSTWVQHLYAAPRCIVDKRQNRGDKGGERRGDSRWVGGVLALTSGVWYARRFGAAV